MSKKTVNHLYHGSCLDVMPHLDLFDMVFMDVPDNIGRDYNEYEDDLPKKEYLDFIGKVFRRTVMMAPIVWISFNAKWLLEFPEIFRNVPGLKFKPAVQIFTFGQQRSDDLKNCHRPLWRFMRPGTPLYPEQILEPTWRSVHGDHRACPRGAVPSDVMNCDPKGDVFEFPRVTGNSKQRRKWHDNQLNEALVAKCVKLCTAPGGRVLDPFGGTGTTGRVCTANGRHCTMIEIDSMYCQKISEETGMEILRVN